MRNLTEQLAAYAAYHRDRRNIATHFVGIPMIVFALCVLLARPAFAVPGTALTISPAWIAGAAAVAAQPTAVWLAVGVGLFVAGWIIQFVGHYFEGRKPAFVDDLIGLLIGPLFVVVEAAFALGFSAELKRAVEAQVGPTLIRRRGAQAA